MSQQPKLIAHCPDCGAPIYEGSDHLCLLREPGGLRDQFAMAALEGLISQRGIDQDKYFVGTYELEAFTASAYRVADAMLEARKVKR